MTRADPGDGDDGIEAVSAGRSKQPDSPGSYEGGNETGSPSRYRWDGALPAAVSRLLRLVWRRRGAPAVSEDELIELSAAAAEADAIDENEREMIKSALTLGDTVTREVMVPRTDMVTVSVDMQASDALELAINRGLSRLPVSDGDIDSIAGIALLRDLVSAERSGRGGIQVRKVMRPGIFVPETKRVDELMREMRTAGGHLAVVVDEYGGTAGLVTLEDLVEELVGEIVDESDHAEPLLLTQAGDETLILGRMPVDQLNTLMDADLPDDHWDTVGGLIFGTLGRVPRVGESVEVGGFKLEVEHMQGRRIARVRLSRV